MLRVFLIRHGETDWNVERRIMGAQAIGLNAIGKAQAHETAGHLAEFSVDALYSSPLLRATETAEILLKDREVSLIHDARLCEVDYGAWVGKTFQEVRDMPGYIPYYQRLHEPVAPEGETLFQVRDRAVEFVNFLKNKHQVGNIFVVSHADWIKCLLMELLEIPLENLWKIRIDNLSVSLVEWEDRGPRVICMNQRGDFERLRKGRSSF